MAGGKHASDDAFEFNFKPLKNINFVKVLLVITVLVVIGGGILCAKMIIDNRNATKEELQPTEPVASETTGLPADLDGFEILGKIKIDKINIEQYILNSKEESALEKGVSKIYGGKLNEKGNFCIAGHNYENIFAKLNELEVGDTFKLIDKNETETSYKIKEIFQSEPEDLSCLIQNEENVEVTLITCENGATTRLIVKAEVLNNDYNDTSTVENEQNTISNEENV